MKEPVTHIPTVFDSEQQHVGEVYARALLGAAKAENKIDAVADQLESLVLDVFKSHPNLELVLNNPKMAAEDKMALLDRVFKSKMEGTLLTFLKVLCRRQRINSIRSIQQAVADLRAEIAGVIRVTATVSSPLDAQTESALIAKLKSIFNKDVRLSTVVDPSILGGLIIRVGDTVFDASVDGQLDMLRKSASLNAENTIREKGAALVLGS